MTEGGAPIGTLIFRVLRWHDRSDILKGARQAYPVKCSQSNVTLLFFPDFSPATAIRRKAFGPVVKMTALGLQPFLIYPAVIKLRHKGNREATIPSENGGFYQLHVSAEVVCRSSAGGGDGGAAAAVSPARREGLDGRDGHGPSCPVGMMAG